MPDAFPRLADQLAEGDIIDFGAVAPEVNELLQQGVAAYYDDRPAADAIFRRALAMAPDQLPTYFCLYKIHTYQGNLDAAREAALAGMEEAARQAGLPAEWEDWPDKLPATGAARFAVYTLKALSFIHLRRGETDEARRILAKLESMGPDDGLGSSVVAALAEAL